MRPVPISVILLAASAFTHAASLPADQMERVTHETEVAYHSRRVIHVRDGEIVRDERRGEPAGAEE